MRKASLEEIKSLWLNRQWKDSDDFHLYISSPFCRVACKYCVYKGKLINFKNEDDVADFNNYYYNYLPNLIDEFTEVITSRKLTSVYFGGGTPNLMSAELMREIFERIPGFKDIPIKGIDLNPVYITEDQIDVMAEYGFTLFCWGVQSFDKASLKNHERSYISPERFKKIVEYTKTKGIYQSADLLCYLHKYNAEDVQIYLNDLQKCMDMDLDFMTMAADFHTVACDQKLADLFVEASINYVRDCEDYNLETDLIDDAEISRRKPITRAIKKGITGKQFMTEILVYYGSNDFPEATSNVLALGDDTSMHEIMSYWPRELFYITKRINDEPAFFVIYENIQSINNIESYVEPVRPARKPGTAPNNMANLRKLLNI
ncbi:radical SAM protein [Lysinibacillus pakistanensis]|uniref:radical SAM protein n=1 Tax=Lysinibacillus pakistanensis TaxID=759811 RepID=UPI003D295133